MNDSNFVWLFSWRGRSLAVPETQLSFARLQWFKRLGLNLVWDSAPTPAAAERLAKMQGLQPTRRMAGGRHVSFLVNGEVPK